MIKLENVGKIYSQKNVLSVGLRKINLELNLGEFVAITGESGSGKSTLLNVICGIDSYEEGELYFNGEKTLDEVRETIKLNTRHLAKRQETWFKNQMESHFYIVNLDNIDETINDIIKDIDDWRLK